MTLPEKVTIQFTMEDGKPFPQKDILIGIQTFAKHKNDINLSPFLSDSEGIIEVKKSDLIQSAEDFIAYDT